MCDGKGRCRRHPIYNKVRERPKPSPTDREEDATRHHATNREQKQPIARNIITHWKSVQLGRSIKADCDKKVTSWAADSSGNQTQERQQIDNKAFMRNKDYKRRKRCSRFVGRTKRTERAPKQPSCRCRRREMRQIGRENRRQGHCPERQKGTSAGPCISSGCRLSSNLIPQSLPAEQAPAARYGTHRHTAAPAASRRTAPKSQPLTITATGL